jgi:hypothetical protein
MACSQSGGNTSSICFGNGEFLLDFLKAITTNIFLTSLTKTLHTQYSERSVSQAGTYQPIRKRYYVNIDVWITTIFI